MNITLINNSFRFDIENMAILFYPRVSVTDGSDGREISVTLEEKTAQAVFTDNDNIFTSSVTINYDLYDNTRCACKKAASEVFRQATGINPPWGLLTGVRPVNFYLKMQKLHGDAGESVMQNEYLVSPSKIDLCRTVTERRAKAVSLLTNDSYSLYISIPFCPSRCKYCSFVSMSTEREKKYVEPYVETLCDEIRRTAQEYTGKSPLTAYIGGGTPTCIDAKLLDKVLKTINESFDMSGCTEFTVEAGRPETITAENLAVMKKNGVTRLSVNPQTLSDEVLRAVGRKHTVADFYKAYKDASAEGFDINVDLIAGLPLETTESFSEGLSKIIDLSPVNITIHSLYIKRAAEYGQDSSLFSSVSPSEETKMLSDACKMLEKAGYFPYYLYRQKNTVGNNENIGFAKIGKECAYNIYMMDDLQSVAACGANAMNKTVVEGDIIRSCNTKFAYNYIKDKGENA